MGIGGMRISLVPSVQGASSTCLSLTLQHSPELRESALDIIPFKIDVLQMDVREPFQVLLHEQNRAPESEHALKLKSFEHVLILFTSIGISLGGTGTLCYEKQWA
jgi:hypothetical protein